MALGFTVVFVALSLYLLPRLKGMFVALQWAKRMHGFGGPQGVAGALRPPPFAIRPAATVILVRRTAAGPRVLMGQRGARAVFMPEMFVFPGGAVDADDLALDGEAPLAAETAARLAVDTAAGARARAGAGGGARALGGDGAGARPPRPRRGGARGPGGVAGVLRGRGRPRTPRRCASSSGRSPRPGGRGGSTRASSSPTPRRSPRAATTSPGRGASSPISSGSTSPRHGRCPCRSSPRWCSSEVEALLAEPGRARGVPFFHQRAEEARFRLL